MRTAVLYYLMRSAYADRPTGAGRHRRINALWEEVRRKFRWSLLSASGVFIPRPWRARPAARPRLPADHAWAAGIRPRTEPGTPAAAPRLPMSLARWPARADP